MDAKLSAVALLCKELLSRPSITPDDAGCQTLIKERLLPLNFQCEALRFGEVDNLWARLGTASPLLVFAGHTDVVPTGPIADWTTPPFSPAVREGKLYGRGAVDMKGAIAAMVCAVETFIKKHPQFPGSIGFLITSDEEGPAHDGTKRVVALLQERQEKMDYCIVGEPSSDKQVGDQIRIGRRGSLHGQLIIHGKQGHVAHPHLAINPIHISAAALSELATTEWDKGNEDYPPTTFQISNIHAGTGAKNVIPGHMEVIFNFRFSTAVTVSELQMRLESILKKHGLNFEIKWEVSAEPFLTTQGKLLTATQEAIKAITQQEVRLSTGGGTSDGRFIAPTGTQVIELGVLNATAHHVNEHVKLEELETLTAIYLRILTQLFA